MTNASAVAALKKEAQTAVENSKKAGGGGLVFLPEGTTKLKLAFDPAGRLCRSVNRYRIGEVTIPKMEDMSEIEGLLKQLSDAGCGTAWKMGCQETIISYAYLTAAQQTNEYLKLNEWVVLGYNYKVYNQLMTRINEWEPDVVDGMLTPTMEMNLWSIDFKKGSKGSAAVMADMKKLAVPALPDNVKPLAECWIPEGATPTPEDYSKAVAYLKNEISKYSTVSAPVSGTAFSPDAPSSDTPSTTPELPPEPPVVKKTVSKEEISAPPVTSTGGISPSGDAPATTPSDGKTCNRADEGRTFGQFEPTPPCLICSNSAECQASNS